MCERRVNLLVYSFSLHQHSYIGFILAFASLIHNKQLVKLSISLQVLAELKAVFKVDAGLEFNVTKTYILPKGVTDQTVFDMVQTIIPATGSLTHLRNDFLVDSF